MGLVRKINQDTVFCSLEPVGLLPNLFIVADGMGGHKAGDLASTEAVRCFIKCIKERSREAEDIVDLMRLALEEANRYVYYLSKESEDYQGMGTTFVAATFCGNSLYCINVGDSRLYKLNRAGEHPMSLKKSNSGSFYCGDDDQRGNDHGGRGKSSSSKKYDHQSDWY